MSKTSHALRVIVMTTAGVASLIYVANTYPRTTGFNLVEEQATRPDSSVQQRYDNQGSVECKDSLERLAAIYVAIAPSVQITNEFVQKDTNWPEFSLPDKKRAIREATILVNGLKAAHDVIEERRTSECPVDPVDGEVREAYDLGFALYNRTLSLWESRMLFDDAPNANPK